MCRKFLKWAAVPAFVIALMTSQNALAADDSETDLLFYGEELDTAKFQCIEAVQLRLLLEDDIHQARTQILFEAEECYQQAFSKQELRKCTERQIANNAAMREHFNEKMQMLRFPLQSRHPTRTVIKSAPMTTAPANTASENAD